MLANVSAGALLSATVFGLIVGAFYGYPIYRRQPPHFPVSLFLVGLSYILILAIWALFDGRFDVEFQSNRLLGWTLLCTAMPVGRWIRLRLMVAALKRRTREADNDTA